MTNCIKCGKSIPNGELFCVQCSKSPVIAELAGAPARHTTQRSVTSRPPTPAPEAAKKKPGKKKQNNKAVIGLSIALALVLGLLIFQQTTLQVEKNRARTTREEAQRQINLLAETEQALADTQAMLEETEEELKEKEQQIKQLSAQLADSQSSQSQGQYDLSNLEKDLEELQEDYTLLQEEHAKMADALEAAAKYQDKAEFLDAYVVFVVNDNSKVYHSYDCADFGKSNFWTYSPKLAQAQGFAPCPKCQ